MKTIFDAKTTCTLSSNGRFTLTIEDRASGCHVMEVTMAPKDFALMLSGRAMQNGKGKFHAGALEVIGKKKEILRVGIPTRAEWMAKLNASRRGTDAHEAVRAELQAALLAAAPAGEGWQLWDDGHRTQQRADNWQGVLARWVPEAELPPLIPCPSCKAKPLPHEDIHPNGIGDHFVKCPECGRESDQRNSESKLEAAERWNRGQLAGSPFED